MPDTDWPHRRKQLADPHIAQLANWVTCLRKQGRGFVPDFDPADGGTQARLLLILEKPGPTVSLPAGSGFVSRDNPTETARAIREGMQAAGVPRTATAVWNLVPWWNGTMRVRVAEARDGAAALEELLPLLPSLRCVVLSGAVARRFGAPVCARAGVRVFECVHPSPNARAGPATSAAWRALPDVWRAAWTPAR